MLKLPRHPVEPITHRWKEIKHTIRLKEKKVGVMHIVLKRERFHHLCIAHVGSQSRDMLFVCRFQLASVGKADGRVFEDPLGDI